MAERDKRKVTSFDVAKRAGVSRSTVSIVINNTPGVIISDKTRKAVWDAIKEMNYHPNIIARSMRSSKSNMLGLIVGIHPTGHFLSNLMAGIQESAGAKGYSLVLAGTGLEEEKMESYATMYLKGQVDGFIVALYTGRTNPDFLASLKATGSPVVIVNGGFKDETLGHVNIDHHKGALEATRHLAKLGHKRIAFVSLSSDGTARTLAQGQKYEGYTDAISEAGLEPVPVVSPPGAHWFDRQAAAQTARPYLTGTNRVTAFYCIHDHLAYGVMDAVREAGLGIPGDVSVIGNDNHPGSSVIHPAMSTVGLPHFDAGKAAADMLIEHLTGTRDLHGAELMLPAHLVVRNSCSHAM